MLRITIGLGAIGLLVTSAGPDAAAMPMHGGPAGVRAPVMAARPAMPSRGIAGPSRRAAMATAVGPRPDHRFGTHAPARPRLAAIAPTRPAEQPANRFGIRPAAPRESYAGFKPWHGREFWPEAYRDIHRWTFSPQGYGRTFWGFAFDDVFTGVFWPPGYASGTTVGQSGPGQSVRSASRATTEQTALSPEFARICSDRAPGLTGWSFQRIRQAVEPTDAQQNVLEAFRAASTEAVEMLRNACPTETPATPPERLDAMANRLSAMLDAVGVVRPALARFYGALSDEQKERFNRVEARPEAGRHGDALARSLALGEGGDAARRCGDEQVSGYRDRTIRHIERVARPTEPQRAALDELKGASAKAAKMLQAACARDLPLTPTGRLDAVERRLATMLRAVKTMSPALTKFYGLLDAEQRARFNSMRILTAGNGP